MEDHLGGLSRAFRSAADGFSVQVLVSPRAKKTRLVGTHDDRLRIQLAAPPTDGEANRELISFFAELFQLPRNHLEIASGRTSRRKTIHARGMTATEALRLLERVPSP